MPTAVQEELRVEEDLPGFQAVREAFMSQVLLQTSDEVARYAATN